MAYGFNDDRSKVEVYSEDEIDAQVRQLRQEVEAEKAARENADDIINADNWVTTNRIANDAVTLGKIKQNLVIFGDSWGAFSEGFENWVDRAHVDKILNASVFNFAIGGSTFGPSTKMISTQVTTAISEMTAEQKQNTRWIVIVGGINDTQDSTTTSLNNIRSSLDAMTLQLNAAYPNARVVWAPNCCAYSLNLARLKGCVRNAWYIRWNDAPYHNYYVVDNLPYFWVGHKSSEIFRSDNLHLNSNGAIAFGNAILSALQGNTAPYSAKETISGLNFVYNTQGQVLAHGIYAAQETGDITIIDELTPLTEFLQAYYMIPESQLWFGSNGQATNFAWLRNAGNTQIKLHANAAESYYF